MTAEYVYRGHFNWYSISKSYSLTNNTTGEVTISEARRNCADMTGVHDTSIHFYVELKPLYTCMYYCIWMSNYYRCTELQFFRFDRTSVFAEPQKRFGRTYWYFLLSNQNTAWTSVEILCANKHVLLRIAKS